MKKCSTCKEEKDKSLFGKDKRLRDGLRSQCKECHTKVTKAWRERNVDRVKEKTRQHYLKNREYFQKRADFHNSNHRNRYYGRTAKEWAIDQEKWHSLKNERTYSKHFE